MMSASTFRLLLLFVLSAATVPVRAQAVQALPDRASVRAALTAEDHARRLRLQAWQAGRAWATALPPAVLLVDVAHGHPLLLTTTNDQAAAATGTDALHPGGSLGLGLTGRGLTVGIWDAGHVRGTHQEFGDRVTHGDAAAVDDHATHVGGTMVASGVDRAARGMAYEASLRSFDWVNDEAEMSAAAATGLLLANRSYALIAGWYYGDLLGDGPRWYWHGDATVSDVEDYRFGWYDSRAAQHDRLTYAAPHFLPVVAAGNDRAEAGPAAGSYRALDASGQWQTYDAATTPRDRDGGADGFDTLAGAAVAKNVLTVGAVGRLGDLFMPTAFTSYGPTDDGRVKPDLLGYGVDVFSTRGAHDAAYGRSSGTSMAAPNVTGTLLLLQQFYQEWFGTPMRAASLKALALHTARDLDLPGPDYRTGWGLLDARAAVDHLGRALTQPLALVEASLGPEGRFTAEGTLETPGPVRVTLAWTDPPSARLPLLGPASLDDPTPHLRVDLDVRLVHVPSGRVYEPYAPDPAHPDRPAAPGDNVRDPVEQVFVAEAPAGAYRVEVTRKGAAADTPAFSLLVDGVAQPARPGLLRDLTAEGSPEGVTLRWATAFELQPGTFTIERLRHAADGGPLPDAAWTRVGSTASRGAAGAYTFVDADAPAGRLSYRVAFAGTAEAREVPVVVPTPRAFTAVSLAPNPFADGTRLVVDVPRAAALEVAVYDLLGRRVALLHDGHVAAGRHAFAWAPGRLAPGLYLFVATLPDAVVKRTGVLVR